MRTARMMLAMSLMVGWTSAAAAECAWVLWVYNSSNAVWTINSGNHTYDQCDRRMADLIKQALSDLKILEKNRVEAFRYNYVFAHKVLGERFYCLPDTIDPREKKE